MERVMNQQTQDALWKSLFTIQNGSIIGYKTKNKTMEILTCLIHIK